MLNINLVCVFVISQKQRTLLKQMPKDDGSVGIAGETSTSFTVPTNLTAGEYYYYCVVSCEDTELKSEVTDVAVCELTDSENPITGAYNSAAARYEWAFDTAVTAPHVCNYSDDYAAIRVGLGSGDEILFNDGTDNSRAFNMFKPAG